jgi:hypothetical protein
MGYEVRNQIKWKIGAAFNLIGRAPPILCPCQPEMQRIRVNQKHITRCLLFDPVWRVFQIDWNLNKEDLIEYLETHNFKEEYEASEEQKVSKFASISRKVNLAIISKLHELIPELKPEDLHEFDVP